MSQFDFESPAGAFAETMAKVLAERKVEERQRLLDSINVAQEQRAQQESQSMDAYRQAQMRSQGMQDEMSRLKVLEQGLDVTSNPQEQLSPEDIQLMQRYGRLVPGAPAGTAGVSSSEQFQLESGDPLQADSNAVSTQTQMPQQSSLRYVGTPEQRDRERKRKEQGALITGMLSSGDPKTAQLAQVLAQAASANDGEIPAPLLNAILQRQMPNEDVYSYDMESGDFSKAGSVPTGATIINRTRPPRDPAGYQPRWTGSFDSEGHPLIYYPSTGKTVVDSTVAAGGKDASANPLGIPPGTISAHRENAALMYASEGEPSPVVVGSFKQTAREAISQARNLTGRVKQLALLYVNDPASGGQQIAVAMGQMPGVEPRGGALTPSEVDRLNEILSITGAREFKQFLSSGKPAPSAPAGGATLAEKMKQRIGG